MNKSVEKVVKKMWMLNVKKYELWNNIANIVNFFAQNASFTLVFQNSFDIFCTFFSSKLPLLKTSFASFTHRTTITTTNLLIEKNFIII